MMQVPLFPNPAGARIGVCGKIDWLKTRRFPQFSQSYFDNSRLHIRQIIESYIFQMKESLHLDKLNRHFRISLIVMIVVIIAATIYNINMNTIKSTGDINADAALRTVQITVNIIYGIGFLIATGIAVMKVQKINQSAENGIQALNMRLQGEGANLYLRLMPENENWSLFSKLTARVEVLEVVHF